MCFGATASYVGAGVVGAAGATTLTLVRDRRELPLALLGVGFAAHQLLEGVVWQQLDAAGATRLRSPAVELWLVFAWVLLPLWVPVAVGLVEPDRARQRLMRGLTALGAVVATTLSLVSYKASVQAVIVSGHLSYVVPDRRLAPPVVAAYVVVTCGPPLLSSHRTLRAWGVALSISMAATAVLQNRGFASVWCYFAALLTVMLIAHLAFRPTATPHRRTEEAGALRLTPDDT
jgi:hypothetical protein